MGLLKLDRFGQASDAAFDLKTVIETVQDTFRNVKVLPGDQLALAAERAAKAGVPEHITRTLRENQQEYGPAYAFEIPVDQGETIQGRARRYDVTLFFLIHCRMNGVSAFFAC